MVVKNERLEADRVLLIALLCNWVEREVTCGQDRPPCFTELRARMTAFCQRMLNEMAPHLSAMGVEPSRDLQQVLSDRLHAAVNVQERCAW